MDHGSILSHPQSLAVIQSVLTELVGGKQPGRRQQQQQGWEDEEAVDDGEDESSGGDGRGYDGADDGYASVRDVKTTMISQSSDVMTLDLKKFPPVLQELVSG